MLNWKYHVATGVFISGGPIDMVAENANFAIVALTRHPNPRLERFDHNTKTIRPATTQEIAAYDVAEVDKLADEEFNNSRLIKAFAMWTASQLNVPVTTMKQDVLAIYRGL